VSSYEQSFLRFSQLAFGAFAFKLLLFLRIDVEGATAILLEISSGIVIRYPGCPHPVADGGADAFKFKAADWLAVLEQSFEFGDTIF